MSGTYPVRFSVAPFAVVDVQSVLGAVLAQSAIVDFLVDPADYEPAIGMHGHEVKAFEKVLQIAEQSQQPCIVGVAPAGSATVKIPFSWLKLAPPPTMNSHSSTR